MVLVSFDDVKNTYKKPNYSKTLLIYRHIFPITPNQNLSAALAYLIGDGHLQKEPFWRIDYTSKDKNELLKFEKLIFSLFKIKGKIRKCTGNSWSTSYNYGINNSVISRTLFLCGVPAGAKVATKFRVPEWILDNKKYFIYFARALYTCEGTSWKGKWPGIGIEMWKKITLKDNGIAFLNDLRKGLKRHCNIRTTNVFTVNQKSINKRFKTIPLKFYIKHKDSIKNFYEQIGFDQPIKQNKLKQIVENFKLR